MLGIEYDNSDFVTNPSRGSLTKFNVHRDFGAFDSLNTWTSLDFSFAKFWNLGETNTFAQRVLAANAWAAYSPTWDAELVAPGIVGYSNRPPSNRGATLGGVERQRGYPRGRFNDKAAINYAVELRLIPRWDPFRNWPLIRNWPWRWWQVVGFAEIGRVATSWDFSELHKDMKWTAGVGFRAMIAGGIIRLDWAVSDEASVFWVMARQAF
jgi:outer membrane protein assembly factor BamA